jgi:B9 domain-containing protein 2
MADSDGGSASLRRSSTSSGASASSGSGRLRSFTSDRLRREEDKSDGENRGDVENGLKERGAKAGGWGGEDKLAGVREKVHRKERRVALNEPELHVIGEIEGGSGFGSGVCCRWQLDHGPAWEQLGGYADGQSQVDYPTDGDSAVWAHPLDAHFLCKGLQGWPRLLLQVWQMDEFGRLHLSGYGFTHVPNVAGSYEIEVETWRPVGTLREEIAANFMGTTPQLRDIDLLFSKAWSDRCRIATTSSGTVRVNVDVVLRNFNDHNVDT